MTYRTIILGLLLGAFCLGMATAQNVPPPTAKIAGRIFAEGRPVDWTVEIRFERQDGSLVATAYTSGSYEFEFWISSFQPDEKYNMVVREPGFKELVYRLDYNDFHYERLPIEDVDTGLYTYSGMLTLELEKLPAEEAAGREQLAGAKTVDVEQIRTQIPEEAQKQYNLAKDYFAKGDAEAGVASLEKVVESAPDYYDAVSRLGSEYLKAGQYEKAEAMLVRARSLNPNEPIALTNLGVVYFMRGEMAAAGAGEDDIDVADYIEDDPDAEPDAAETFYRKALESLQEAHRQDPLTPRTGFYLGTVLYRMGDYDQAESMLADALAQDGQLHDARLSLLNIYIRQKRYGEALQQISAYLDANPQSPQREQLEKLKTQIETTPALGKDKSE